MRLRPLIIVVLVALVAASLSSCVFSTKQKVEMAWNAYHPNGPFAPFDQARPGESPRDIGVRIVGGAAGCIIDHESGGDPRAVSPTRDFGLFQINIVHVANFQRVTGRPFFDGVYDPTTNALYAKYLHDTEGWSPWSTHRACGV